MDQATLLFGVCALALGILPLRLGAAMTPNAAPAFNLPRHGSSGRIELDYLHGQIVVLDFFAYWCAPCVRASAEIQQGIARYYQERKGNPRGIEVRSLAVNVEPNHPELTDAFIRRAGLEEVLDDSGGKVFQDYGATAMPFVVVIDATVSPPRIIYSKAGFEGVPKLREVIDSLGLGAIQPLTSGVPAHTGAATTRVGSATFSVLGASDILLMSQQLEYYQIDFRSALDLSLNWGYISARYQPESLLEQSKDIEAENFGLQAGDRIRVGDYWTFLLGGGAYSGYMDYRSLWFNEHFEQLFAGRDGYEKAHPWGGNFSTGGRWEYLPAAGFLQGEVIVQHDVISPGYDVSIVTLPPQLQRYRDAFDTLSGRLTFENVLSSRLRALQEVQATDTTDRQLRVSLQSSLNWALSERWVTRLAIFGVEESPRFDAASVDALITRDWNNTWFVGLVARAYWDNGEIENALLVANTSDPPLKTLTTGLDLRWQGRRSFLKVFAGPYFTDYRQTGTALTTFPHLYQNRDWISVQCAYSYQF